MDSYSMFSFVLHICCWSQAKTLRCSWQQHVLTSSRLPRWGETMTAPKNSRQFFSATLFLCLVVETVIQQSSVSHTAIQQNIMNKANFYFSNVCVFFFAQTLSLLYLYYLSQQFPCTSDQTGSDKESDEKDIQIWGKYKYTNTNIQTHKYTSSRKEMRRTETGPEMGTTWAMKSCRLLRG